MAARDFGFNVSYRPIAPELVGDEPDQRPVNRLPSFSPATVKTEAEREQKLLEECLRLEQQGYRVERVERWNTCQRCQGTGDIRLRPKGWRKKTAPPWYAMRKETCPDCGGGGAEHQTESVTDVQA